MPLSRKDEIGELATAFHDMVQKRRQAEEALRLSHDELDARVMERTRELAEANELLRKEITERMVAEQAAVRLQLRQELIFSSIGEGIHWIGPDGKIHFENSASARKLGWSASEIVGRPAHDTMHQIYARLRTGAGCHVDNE